MSQRKKCSSVLGWQLRVMEYEACFQYAVKSPHHLPISSILDLSFFLQQRRLKHFDLNTKVLSWYHILRYSSHQGPYHIRRCCCIQVRSTCGTNINKSHILTVPSCGVTLLSLTLKLRYLSKSTIMPRISENRQRQLAQLRVYSQLRQDYKKEQEHAKRAQEAWEAGKFYDRRTERTYELGERVWLQHILSFQ